MTCFTYNMCLFIWHLTISRIICKESLFEIFTSIFKCHYLESKVSLVLTKFFLKRNVVFYFQTTIDVPGLKPGMKLEAVDRNNPPSFCVATVIQQVGHRVRIRYDGFGKDSSNDCWCNFQAEELHPIGWCAQNGYPLQPPKGILISFGIGEDLIRTDDMMQLIWVKLPP